MGICPEHKEDHEDSDKCATDGVGLYVNGVQDGVARSTVSGNGQHAHSHQGQTPVKGIRSKEVLQRKFAGDTVSSTTTGTGSVRRRMAVAGIVGRPG
jgi:hypothetical protein